MLVAIVYTWIQGHTWMLCGVTGPHTARDEENRKMVVILLETLLYLLKPRRKLLSSFPCLTQSVVSWACMARGPGLRWAIPFALVARVASFQLIGSPIVSKIACGGGTWRSTAAARRPFRCNHVRDLDASGTSTNPDSGAAEYDQARREDASVESGRNPLVEYFARWDAPFWCVYAPYAIALLSPGSGSYVKLNTK